MALRSVSALKSKTEGKKKNCVGILFRQTVLHRDGAPQWKCHSDNLSAPTHHVSFHASGWQRTAVRTRKPGCRRRWYLQRWNRAALAEACLLRSRTVDEHFTGDGFGQRFRSDSALLPFALWFDCGRCCMYFLVNGIIKGYWAMEVRSEVLSTNQYKIFQIIMRSYYKKIEGFCLSWLTSYEIVPLIKLAHDILNVQL